MTLYAKYIAIALFLSSLFLFGYSLRPAKDESRPSPLSAPPENLIQEKFVPPAIPESSSPPAAEKAPPPSPTMPPPVPPPIPSSFPTILAPLPEILPQTPPLSKESSLPPEASSQPMSPPQEIKTLPPLDTGALFRAVVKIQCPTKDGLGKYIGSGFVIKGNKVITAAHVIMDSASETCDIIFPRERSPIHYLRGAIENLQETKQRHDEKGIDVALLSLPSLETYPEAQTIFSEYPAIPYPPCESPAMIGDKLLHFGYPSNYADQNYLSELEGEAVINADIKGVKEQLSQDSTYTYKSPIFGFTNDQTELHPYMVSRVPSFYGDSGGLAFNATKQCVVGPHRGGTIGKGAGENYSVFMNLGWVKTKGILILSNI